VRFSKPSSNFVQAEVLSQYPLAGCTSAHKQKNY